MKTAELVKIHSFFKLRLSDSLKFTKPCSKPFHYRSAFMSHLLKPIQQRSLKDSPAI